jgi:ornithine cyclodeaminase/alanine dehydrogenase-like protein (mu-crystallin family)
MSLKPLFLTESDVKRLLPMGECIALVRAAFERLGRGAAINHPRQRLILPTRSVLHYMAGADGAYYGIKVYSSNPGHEPHFRFLLYRASDAALLAILEANALGQIRTGAASGLATDLSARPDARTLAVIGSGFQARTQVEAMLAVRPFQRVRVWSRSAEKRESFAADCARDLGATVEAAASAEAAVRGADVLVTATNSGVPVVASEWVADGAHVNAMGSNQAKRREIPSELVHRAGLIVVDSREQSRMESGDLLLAFVEQDWSRVVELQELLAGHVGRTRPDELTIFKSNGLAIEDVVAAGYVYERAMEEGPA